MSGKKYLFSLLMLIVIGGLSLGQSGGNFVIKDATLEGSGHTSSGGNFVSEIRVGQGLAGPSMSGGSFAVGGGILPSPPPPSPITKPDAPAELTASAYTSSEIELEWQDISNNEDGFVIESCSKGKNCVSFVVIAEVGPGETAFRHSGLKANTQYRYRVRAFNTAGTSDYSNIAATKTLRR